MEKLLLTRREVASMIGLSVETVETLCKSGQLKQVKIGRSVRVHIDDLQQFTRTGTRNKTASGAPLHPLWQGKTA